MKKHSLKKVAMFYAVTCLLMIQACGAAEEEIIGLCGREPQQMQIDITSELSDNVDMNEVCINIPKGAGISTFCVYEDNLYYSLDYIDYLEYEMNVLGEARFRESYNTQIRVHNISTGMDTLLYSYDEDFCVQTTDMQSNGKILVWEHYGIESDSWSIMMIDMNCEENVGELSIDNAEKGRMSTVTLTIDEENLFWYDMIENEAETETNSVVLKRYDFDKKEIYTEQTELYLSSPYEHVSIIDNVCTTYSSINKDVSSILIHDMKTDEKKELQVDGQVCTALSNGEFCVWMGGIDYYDRFEIFIYDLNTNEYKKIESKYVFSYGIVGEYLVLNREDGLWIYDISENKCNNLIKSESTACGYTFQSFSGSLYMEYWKNECETCEFIILQEE